MNRIIYICLLLLLDTAVDAQIALDGKKDDITLQPHNSVFGDTITFPKSDLYWVKATILNQSSEHYLLECLSPHISGVKIIIQGTHGKQLFYETGALYPFSNRILLHKNFVVPLPMWSEKYSLYIGVKNYKPGDLYFKIRSYHLFAEYATSEYFFLGLYYGMLSIVFFYNLFLYLKRSPRVHLLYALYIVGCMMLSFKEDGLSYQYLWPQFPALHQFMVNYAAEVIFLITFVLYSFEFLEIKKINQRIGIFLLCATMLHTFFIFLSSLNPGFYPISETVFFATFLSVYFISWYVARRGNGFAYYFVTGFTVVLASIGINLLRSIDFLPSNIFTVYIFNYGIIIEVIIFSIALAERIKQVRREKEAHKETLILQMGRNDSLQKQLITELEEKKDLQQKINRELELKVAERTIELEEANRQLKIFAAETDRLNSELDKYNYSLKKEIRQEKISRIDQPMVSYNQFLEIYMTDDACLRTIQELKWPDGFTCRKCGYKKAGKTSAWHRMKCNKCGHIESITSNTLFHHLKFSLNKAFYITSVEFSNLPFTNESLSELLSLRKPTVWAFRNKVNERLKEKKYMKAKGWKDIITDKS